MRRFLFSLAVITSCEPLLAQTQHIAEEIVVERILIDARVTDAFGEPILGLTAADFNVRVDGKSAKVESVLWIPETIAAHGLARALDEGSGPAQPPPPGRLFIYFVQTDFARHSSRVRGQLHFLPYARKMIDSLEPDDRVAVFSFDSHMKFHLDFSGDRSEIANAMSNAITTAEPPWPRSGANPSLAAGLDRQEMRTCYRPEIAFVHIANAVRSIPGPKSMIVFGWGLGYRAGRTVFGTALVSMDPAYPTAFQALERARVTVFALDMSVADYHDLEIGLQKTAADTGGFYARTHRFPQTAVDRLQKTLSGRYELEVRRPDGLPRGTHTIEVRLNRRSVHYVMARSGYMDRAK